MNDLIFYRYEAKDVAYAKDWDGEYIVPTFPNIRLHLKRFKVIKETANYYRISHYDFDSKWSKLVSKTARKKYAYLTKVEALQNYKLRTERYINILKKQLVYAEMGLDAANEFKIVGE